MKKFLILFTLLTLCLSTSPVEAKYVKGYRRSNGTYVSGHHKTKADKIKANNYSAKGHRAPSGRKGYRKY